MPPRHARRERPAIASERRREDRRQIRETQTIEDTGVYVLNGAVGRRYDKRGNPKRIHPSAEVPHGTVGGYSNWKCSCLWTPGTRPQWWPAGAIIPADHTMFPRPGCEQAAVRANRCARLRRKAEAPTMPLRTVPPKRKMNRRGRHAQPDTPTARAAPEPPAGSAYAQLTQADLAPRKAPNPDAEPDRGSSRRDDRR